MATKITDLPEITDGAYDLNDLLIIYDTLQEKTSTIRASRFRGRGIYISTLAPDPAVHLEEPNITAYLMNDLYYHTQGAQVTVHQFDGTDFNVLMNLRTPSNFTSDFLPLDLTVPTLHAADVYLDNDFFIAGDRYLNLGDGLEYTYSATGFNFVPEDREYVNTRGVTRLIGQVTVAFDTQENPRTGDQYLGTVAGKDLLWTYDETLEVGATWDIRRLAGWGEPVDTTVPRIHSMTADPVWDDTIYSANDYAIITRDGEKHMWGPYIAEMADQDTAWLPADRIELTSDRLISSTELLDPDNTLYSNGDWQKVNDDDGNHYYVGPYDRAVPTWGARIDIRAPRIFEHNGVVATFVMPVGLTPVAGDYVECERATGKVERYGPWVAGAAGFHVLTYRIIGGGKWHSSTSLIRPVREHDTYSPGDMILNGAGIAYGPYDDTALTDMDAWPNPVDLPSLAAAGNPVIQRDDLGASFEIRVDNQNNVYLVEV